MRALRGELGGRRERAALAEQRLDRVGLLAAISTPVAAAASASGSRYPGRSVGVTG